MSNDTIGSSDRSRITLHVRVLMEPTRFSLTDMISAMKQLYAAHGIHVEVSSTERISRPDLMDVEVGRCVSDETTAEQRELFSIRGNISSSEIVVYCCRSTDPPYNGCAAHPAGIPACVIVAGASKWSLAHEVGHVLGLPHVDRRPNCLLDRLMTECGTDNITNLPPDFAPSEITKIRNSGLVK